MHCFTLLSFLLLIPVLNTEFSADFIGDLSHYSIIYNLHTDGVKDQLESILRENPERVVAMKTPDQQAYKCILPLVENKAQRKIEEYKGPSPLELLQPLIDEREISIYGGTGYWFYDIAHGRFIRQYHDNRDTKESTEYLLGTYRHDQSLEDAKKFDQLHPPKTKINNIEYPYFPVPYRHGTPCDLTGKPRQTTLLYICYEYSRHMVHSITEVSTCNYEIAILTNLLCSHPAFDMPTTPEHEIRCYAPPKNVYPKPANLREIEQRAVSEHYEQYSLASDSSVAPHKSSVFSKLINLDNDILPQRLNENNLKMAADNTEGEEKSLTDQLREVMDMYKKLRASGVDSHPNKMVKFQKGFTDQDFQLIDDFWSSKSCFIGGQGYWSYEFCYNNKVSQFHLEGGKRTKENVLGEYDPDIHKAWLQNNRYKAFVHENDYVKQVSNYYGNGAVCEETGEKRAVEVRLRCRMPAATESPSIVLFSLEEPKTCKYILLLESALLCHGLQLLDKDGLMDPNTEQFTEVLSEEEILKSIVENLRSTKQYLESFQAEITVKDITDEVEGLLKNSKKTKKKDETEEKKKNSEN